METKEALKTIYVVNGARNFIKVNLEDASYTPVATVMSAGYMIQVPEDGTILHNGSTIDAKANDVFLTLYADGVIKCIKVTSPEVTDFVSTQLSILENAHETRCGKLGATGPSSDGCCCSE